MKQISIECQLYSRFCVRERAYKELCPQESQSRKGGRERQRSALSAGRPREEVPKRAEPRTSSLGKVRRAAAQPGQKRTGGLGRGYAGMLGIKMTAGRPLRAMV